MKIVVLGGGFGGIRTALDLAKQNLPNARIQLISDRPHFEMHAALYRVVTGRSPLEVCVPLAEIFQNKSVEILIEKINKIDLAGKVLTADSGSRYSFDYLVLALGSSVNYFGISGLPEHSFGFTSIGEALRLKNHLHSLFQSTPSAETMHLVIVGGGAAGVELAGELANYCAKVARQHDLNPVLLTIDLIEAASRLLPALPPDISARVKSRLHRLGVNIFLGRMLKKEEVEGIELADMTIKAKTIIWTAGVKNNPLLAGVAGLEFDKKGRVLVDEYLQAKNFKHIFVIGDGAATPYAGMAQTAIHDGAYVAEVINNLLRNQKPKNYQPARPVYSIPVGPGWAATLLGNFPLYGRPSWWLRRAADLRYYLSILPFGKAWLAWRAGEILSESCPVCNPQNQRES